MNDDGIVIAGAGQSGYQLAVSLRQTGYAGKLRLIGEERQLPYQRPPLSKAFLARACEFSDITFQDASFYREQQIELDAGKHITSIDRHKRCIITSDGDAIRYGHLVLALGARARCLPHASPHVTGIFTLRTLPDAQALRDALDEARNVVVVGAGFLGLEFAAIAATEGKTVTVIETSRRLMANTVSQSVAEAFARHHESRGVRFLFADAVSELRATNGRVVGVSTESGQQIDADIVVACIGVTPNVELAERAGLRIDNGIVVDACLRTTDPSISALGDCASFPTRFAPYPCRLESIQNATDQARHLAQCLTSGTRSAFDAVPWFWSDQGGLKLQIAGINREVDTTAVRGDVEARRFSAFGFRQGRLVTVESVASPGDHMIARRLLATGKAVAAADIADTSVSLRDL